MSPSSPHRRLKSSTKADILTSMLKSAPTARDKLPIVPPVPRDINAPRDSLSPLENPFADNQSTEGAGPSMAGTRKARTQQDPHITFQENGCNDHATAIHSVSTTSHTASSPRSTLITRPHRPTDLKLDRSNGLTTIPITDLKQLIGNVHTEACATKTQVPRPKPRKRAPKTPALAMGNKPSSVNGSPEPDDASLNSVVRRRPMRVLRKSSTNLFKRIDSKSPLPRPLTATSIVVTDRKPPEHDESPIDPFMEPAHKAREPIILHSDSTITVDIHSGSSRQSSATTTVVSSGKENRISFQATIEDASEHEEDEPPVPAPRASALSPTIPAPSPLPEDSPHKYGLKDRMETPEPDAFEPPPEPTELNKARRRSSGLEIFNEAKSLQSAQSFLNGLSTSRRRAESTNRTDTTCTTTTTSTSRPASRPTSRPSSSMHLNANPNGNGNTDHGNNPRTRGHNFKPTGFAYSRALTLPQLSCFRSHARLLRSRNKAAPVECAVCHMDDEHEHWTCSWCALRMCRYCRRAFVEGGVKALRGRVREAEMGAGSESEGGRGRGRSRGVV